MPGLVALAIVGLGEEALVVADRGLARVGPGLGVGADQVELDGDPGLGAGLELGDEPEGGLGVVGVEQRLGLEQAQPRLELRQRGALAGGVKVGRGAGVVVDADGLEPAQELGAAALARARVLVGQDLVEQLDGAGVVAALAGEDRLAPGPASEPQIASLVLIVASTGVVAITGVVGRDRGPDGVGLGHRQRRRLLMTGREREHAERQESQGSCAPGHLFRL